MKTIFTFLSSSALMLATLHANPVGGRVTHGNVTFDINGKNLTIHQGSDKAIIHWDDFSVSLDEITRFVQPSSNSAALNRVTGALPSTIDGALQANGKLILLNPNGILVGPGGRIDTNSFIGSSLGLTDSDFLAGGDMTFAGDSTASVINLGTINAVGGDIFLFGRNVENHGTLNAPAGTAGLGASQEVLLKQSGDERVFVQPSGTGKSATGIDNSGTIAAATAELKAHGNLYALAVNNSGIVRATGATKKNGRVLLTAPGGKVDNSGTLTARNADRSGGTVRVTGDDITLSSTSIVDASGESAGGRVNIGGGYQGNNPTITNASSTSVAPGATISANTATGNAGEIVVWADGTTTFAGTISARSLDSSGPGGDAEVSGATHLSYTGSTDLRGAAGKYGTLLLDPGAINVTNDPSPGTDAIRAATLAADLANANVTITTSDATGAIAPDETVTFETGVNLTWSAPTTLAVEAGRNIVVSPGSSINSSGNGSIIFNANRGPVPTPGSFNGIRVGGRLTSAGGQVVLNGTAGTGNGIGVYVVSPITAGSIDNPDTGIFIDGVGGTAFNNPGVLIEEQNSLNATFGQINVTGSGVAGGVGVDNSQGIKLHDTARIVSDGSGPNAATITLIGQGTPSAGLNDNDGVTLIGESFIRSVDGDITISGTGSNNSTDRSGGVLIASGTIESTGSGNLSITGEAISTSGTNNNGVRLGFDFSGTGNFIAPTVATNSGDLEITGNSPDATGIRIETPSSVRTQSGNVTLTGRGGSPDRQIVAPQGIAIDQNSGTFTFDGQLESPSLTTSPGTYETRFLGAANIGSGVTFNNSGGLTVNASLDIDGDLTANAGPTNLRGSISTGYDSIRLGHVELTDGLPSRSIRNSVANDLDDGSDGTSTLISIDSVSAPQATPLAFTIQAGPDTDITIGDLDPAARMNIVSGRDASINSNAGLNVDIVHISGNLNLTAVDDITAGPNTRVSGISASSTMGSIDLDSSFDRVQNLIAAGNISAFSDRMLPVTVDGSVASSGGDILLFANAGDLALSPSASIQTPGDIILGSGNNFVNTSTDPNAVQAGGRTLVYTASVEGVTLGAISVDATEYGKTFPDLPDTETGNILLTINNEVVDPPVVDPPTTPPSTPGNTGDKPDKQDKPATTADPPTARVALLDLIRRSAPRGSSEPEEDNPINPIAANPRHLVAQLDSSSSSDILPPRAAPRPFFGAPFAGYLFAGPGSDLSLSPELGPVTFGSGGTFGTPGASVPKELLESLSEPAVKELKDALQNP